MRELFFSHFCSCTCKIGNFAHVRFIIPSGQKFAQVTRKSLVTLANISYPFSEISLFYMNIMMDFYKITCDVTLCSVQRVYF